MRRACLISLAAMGLCSTSAMAQWVNFQNETATRLVAPANLVVNDNIEKAFCAHDFDNDGDTDLAVGRKFPGSIQGGFRNLLLMNENGVLTDRTNEYATASDVPGDQGFLAPTNDRDIRCADVNLDGWMDLVTATTMSDQVTDILGQPRVYMNLGEDANGNWLGFRFEDGRMPILKAKNGSTANPRFCDFAVGDFTGDGYPDLFFVDYDTPETSGTVCIDLNQNGSTADPGECQLSPAETSSKDYDNKLIINQGAGNPGFFTDTTNTRFTTSQLTSAFGNAAFAADMNGDGLLDIVRINTLTGGQNAAVFYPNNPQGTSWAGPDSIYTGAPYHMAPADINGDGKMDLCMIDDSKDRFLINTGNGADTFANFTQYTINDSLTEFGNDPSWADLDNDGYPDLMVADIDADLPQFCPSSGRRGKIYRNTFGITPVLSTNTLDEQGQVIPNTSLNSTFEFCPMDINGDGWMDLVVGRCLGIQIWMNQPPISLGFTFPNGLPTELVPGEGQEIVVDTAIIGGGSVVPGSAKLNYSIDGGPFVSEELTSNGGNSWTASLPALECGSQINYYFEADLSNGPVFFDPAGAPAATYSALAIDEIINVFTDAIETGAAGWTTSADASTTGGQWEAATPIGTVVSGAPAAPSTDASPVGSRAFVTQNGVAGGAASASDLDGGPVTLTSPTFDLDGADGTVSYARWFYCDDVGVAGADSFVISISNDGGANWVTLETVTTNAGAWVTKSFRVSDFVVPSATMQVRFVTSDNPNNSTTEAGVDDFKVDLFVCDTAIPCPADFDGNGVVDGADLGELLALWGTPDGDLSGDGNTDGADLGEVLAAWGACPTE